MTQRNIIVIRYILLLMLTFLVGKVGFLCYNAELNPASLGESILALFLALPQDLVMAFFLAVVPQIVTDLASPRLPLRCVLAPYYFIVALAIAAFTVGDTCMYEFWGFKLHAVIFSYMAHPEGATNSVSLGFILARVVAILVLLLLAFVPALCFTPKHLCEERGATTGRKGLLVDVILAAIFFGGIGLMNVGRSYTSDKLFLNHAATNSMYNLAASFFDHTRWMDDEEAEATTRDMYTPTSSQITDSLLTTQQPNVLLVMMESYGGKFIGELGGIKEVSPEFSRLIPEGVFWDQFYANSFRTDRGTLSSFAGQLGYPTISYMTMPETHATLPSLAKSLKRHGYSTYYLMGGAMTNMGKETYLRNSGFDTLYNDKHGFTADELATGAWGANDSISAMRTVDVIRRMPKDKPWFMGYQTLSSHEPFDVPYHRLDNMVENAFAYTDHCMGMLIDSLKTLPEWDNMLVIFLADHGFMYQLSYQDPEFFHIPMLWMGGAIREPRRMSVLMNQSDVCATLLAQMGYGHDEYRWSRNVLSPDYTYPFVYSSYPAGLLFKDASGTTLIDIMADKVTYDQGDESAKNKRIQRAKAALQISY